MWNLKYDTNEPTCKTETDIGSRLVVAEREGIFEEGRIRRLRLAIDANCYIGWINSEVLLHSTDNCIQYPVISYNGKEYEKEHTYV